MSGEHKCSLLLHKPPELAFLHVESALFVAHELEKLLDEDMTEEEAREFEEAEAIGRKFLAWNLADETVIERPPKDIVAEILGAKGEGEE